MRCAMTARPLATPPTKRAVRPAQGGSMHHDPPHRNICQPRRISNASPAHSRIDRSLAHASDQDLRDRGMNETIRQYVLRRLAEGAHATTIYGEVQRRFPRNRASWNYVSRIEREFFRKAGA